MIVDYQLVHPPSLPRRTTTADVAACRFTFSFEQVQAGIRATINGPICDARRPGATQLRNGLASLGMAMIVARQDGAAALAIRDADWPCWFWVCRHLRGSAHEFLTVNCAACNQIFNAVGIRSEPFDADGCGGTRHRCPAGHVLYADFEWIS